MSVVDLSGWIVVGVHQLLSCEDEAFVPKVRFFKRGGRSLKILTDFLIWVGENKETDGGWVEILRGKANLVYRSWSYDIGVFLSCIQQVFFFFISFSFLFIFIIYCGGRVHTSIPHEPWCMVGSLSH